MNAQATAAIDVRGINKSFGQKHVVRDLSLQVQPGEIFGFLGPNGSGKTTSIRMMCGLLTPDSGSGTCLGYDMREIVTEGGQLRQRLLKLLRFEYVEHLIKAVAAAQRRGETDPQLEPRLIIMSIIGNTLLPLAAGSLLHQIPLLRDVTRDDLERHAEAILVGAFSGRPRRRES